MLKFLDRFYFSFRNSFEKTKKNFLSNVPAFFYVSKLKSIFFENKFF